MNFYKNLGAHLSISGGPWKIFDLAEELKINNIQCFTSSNIRWSFKKKIDEEILEKYLNEKKFFENKYKFVNVFSHACYLINLASDKKEIKEKSEDALISEIFRCSDLKIKGVVFHPGSNKDKKEGIRLITESIKKIKNETPDDVKIFLENSAGAGNSLPGTIEEITELFNSCYEISNRIGIVIDTCHVHAKGYDFSNEKEQDFFWEKIDKNIGLEKIGFIHLNDSKKPSGSKLDRHENICDGTIGKSAFEVLLKNKKLKDIIKIIETPFSGIESYKSELKKIEVMSKF